MKSLPGEVKWKYHLKDDSFPRGAKNTDGAVCGETPRWKQYSLFQELKDVNEGEMAQNKPGERERNQFR